MNEKLQSLSNLEDLIDGAGQVTIGAVAPVQCAAIATNGRRPLAMLVRRNGESLAQLLGRLDKAVNMAHQEDTFIDEINNGPDERI